MYVGRDFYPAGPSESLVYAFDFVNDIGQGETKLNSVTWELSVVWGDDPLYMHRLQGNPFIFTPLDGVQPTATMQRIGGLQPGVLYRVKATAIMDDTDVKTLWSHIYGEAEL